MIVYKLTNQKMQTHGGFQWELGKQYTTGYSGDYPRLCSPDVFHAYSSPELALLLNPIHADFYSPRLFKARGEGTNVIEWDKSGHTSLKLVEELHLVITTTTQRTAFGILCAQKVCKDKTWQEWARNWLSGKDRRRGSDAHDAYAAAGYAAAAAHAAYAAYAAHAAYAAAAYTAAYAASYTASYTAAAAAAVNISINFNLLAKKAMKY